MYRRIGSLRGLLVVTTTVFLGAAQYPSARASAMARRPSATAVRVPAVFVANAGQYDRQVRFYSRGAAHAIFATDAGLTLAFEPSPTRRIALRLGFVGARESMCAEPGEPDRARVNYFRGRDERSWQTNLTTYHQVLYRDVWAGIDAAVGVESDRLKYEFRVAPGAETSRIRMRYEGATDLRIGETGELRIGTEDRTLTDAAPRAFQRIGGTTVDVPVVFSLFQDGEYSITVGKYDRTQPLIIDPAIVYASYLGSSGADEGFGIAVDGSGSAYVTGYTQWIDFPTTTGVYQTGLGGGDVNNPKPDAFVAKINPSGSALVFATYLGGSDYDVGSAIAVDSGGNAYVTGTTSSRDFPTTPGAFQRTFTGASAFVTKLDPAGSALVYSTYYGGIPDPGFSLAPGVFGYGIAIDANGRAYIVGATGAHNLPGAASGFQPTFGGRLQDGFLMRLSATGDAVEYASFIGGSPALFADAAAYAVAVNGTDAFVTGITRAPDFPTTAPNAIDAAGPPATFMTSDAGANWSPLMAGLHVEAIQTFAQDPTDPAIIYAGSIGQGIYKSLNGGNDWMYSGDGIPAGVSVFSIAVNPTASNIVYAATSGSPYGTVYKSTDGGASWSASLVSSMGWTWSDVAVNVTGTAIFVVGGEGLWRSIDDGANWTLVVSRSNIRVTAVMTDPSNPSTVFMGSFLSGVYRSTDNGTTWTAASGMSTIVRKLRTDKSTSSIYAACDGAVFKSTNGGVSFSELPAFHIPIGISDVALDSSTNPTTIYAMPNTGGNELLAVSYSGLGLLLKSTDGGSTATQAAVRNSRVGMLGMAMIGPSTLLVGVYRGSDAFVSRVNTAATGSSSLVYSTYLGGAAYDVGKGIAVDEAGHAYVTGWTTSGDFPMLPSNPPRTVGTANAFVAKLSPTGSSLSYSTVVGGNTWNDARAIGIDSAGNAYIAGLWAKSANYVRKISSDGIAFTPLLFGGHNETMGANGIAVDGAGSEYVVGSTPSTDFPTTLDSFQPGYGSGGSDAFVAKLVFQGSDRPDAPNSPNPPSGATWVTVTPTLSWTAKGATFYEVRLGTTSPPPTIVSETTDWWYPTPRLNGDTTYYWQIVAKNGSGTSDGPIWTFRTEPTAPAPGPAAPNSPNPPNAATWVTVTPTLSWRSAGATSYEIRFGTANPPPTVESNTADFWYATPRLNPGTTYFWQIVAANSSGTTAGPVWSFTTDPTVAPPGPGEPSSPNPPSGATWVTVTPTLSWHSDGATSYEIRFGTSSSPPTVESNTTEYWYATPRLNPGTTYYWQIVAKNGNGTTAGPIWSFTTDPTAEPPPR